MAITQNVFRYKTVKGILHKVPAILKLFMFLPLCIFCMSLTAQQLAAGIITAAIIAFICGFTLREQLTDFKPAAFYAVLMYLLSALSNFFEKWRSLTGVNLAAEVFLPRHDFAYIVMRLVLIIQLSALFFRTTSSIELRSSLCLVESLIRRSLPFLGRRISQRTRFAENISLFLSFIPEIFTNWAVINLAWKARCGKQGIGKIKTVVFVLISLSMEKAAVKAKALAARSGE